MTKHNEVLQKILCKFASWPKTGCKNCQHNYWCSLRISQIRDAGFIHKSEIVKMFLSVEDIKKIILCEVDYIDGDLKQIAQAIHNEYKNQIKKS